MEKPSCYGVRLTPVVVNGEWTSAPWFERGGESANAICAYALLTYDLPQRRKVDGSRIGSPIVDDISQDEVNKC